MSRPRPRDLARQYLAVSFDRPAALARLGVKRHAIEELIRDEKLIRLRNGRYVPATTHPDLVRAGTFGGRLDCISLLRLLEIFVFAHEQLHMQVDRSASRLPARPEDVLAHWRSTDADAGRLTTDIVEALAQACRCQQPRHAIATLDSAWHHGLVDEADIAAVFALLPRRHRRLRALLDRRSESGPETLMRLLLRGLGAHVEVQVKITGVGRVDLVVDGWLIVECDSRAHHEGWDSQREDRRRDLAAAALGYTTVRPIAEDILYAPEKTLDMMRSVLAHGPRTVGRTPARSRSIPPAQVESTP